MPHLVAALINLSQNYSYYIRGDRSPLISLNKISWKMAVYGLVPKNMGRIAESHSSYKCEKNRKLTF